MHEQSKTDRQTEKRQIEQGITVVREVIGSCSSLDLVLKGSRTVGYTDACETSVELGSEGTDVAAVTCDAKETDSAFLFCKPSRNKIKTNFVPDKQVHVHTFRYPDNI